MESFEVRVSSIIFHVDAEEAQSDEDDVTDILMDHASDWGQLEVL